jgi:hypothetical protein
MHVAVPIAIAFILLRSYEAFAQTTQPQQPPTPIFNGAPGFALLTLATGLGLYLPAVEMAARERYAKIARELRSSAGDAATQLCLANLKYVQTSLECVISCIFLFILVVAARLVVYAAWVICQPTGSMPVKFLYWWDLAMVLALAVFVPILWRIKYWKSEAESGVEKIRELRKLKPAPTASTPTRPK